MRYPKALREQGTIGVTAPSFGCVTEPYKSAFVNAQRQLAQRGFSVKVGETCGLAEGIGISSTPQRCARELTQFMTDPACDVVLSAGGGEMMCEVISRMDFDALAAADPKWFMGFSDNTNMTYLLATACDTASVYGPNAPAFGMKPWHPVLDQALELLMGTRDRVTGFDLWEKEGLKDEQHPLEPYHLTEPKILHRLDAENGQVVECGMQDEPVRFHGRMLGGCLDCLANLAGTRWDYTAEFMERYPGEKVVWFLEACDYNPMDIRRAIWRLGQTGWFDHTAGFLIGRPGCYGVNWFGLDHYHAFTDLLQEYQVPVILDVDLGHLPPSMPILCGATGHVEIRDAQISVTYEKN